MKKIYLARFGIILLFIVGSCQCTQKSNTSKEQKIPSLKNVSNQFANPSDDYVLVCAHRGDWRNAPENSMQAIQNCISIGIDMVEVDLKKTKDGEIILMHDKTLDRTTNGSGRVKDYSLKEINQLFLTNGYGMITNHKIPVLGEVLMACKGKILLMLDKGYPYLEEVLEVAKEMNMIDQIYFEGKQDYSELKQKIDKVEHFNYMPRVNLHVGAQESNDKYISDFLMKGQAYVFIVSFKHFDEYVLRQIKRIKDEGGKVMLTTLWDSTCGGFTDDEALKNPEAHWGKAVRIGADLICTDRPIELLEYLKSKELHN